MDAAELLQLSFNPISVTKISEFLESELLLYEKFGSPVETTETVRFHPTRQSITILQNPELKGYG